MSWATVYSVLPNGEVSEIAELRNSNRGAAWLWCEVCKRLGQEETAWLMAGLRPDGFNMFANTELNKLSVPDRAALLSTCDRVIVEPEWIDFVADALEQFEPGTEVHKGMALAMRAAKEAGCRGVCFHQTSTSGDVAWWFDPTDEEDEGRPLNIFKDTTTSGGKPFWWFGEGWLDDWPDPRPKEE